MISTGIVSNMTVDYREAWKLVVETVTWSIQWHLPYLSCYVDGDIWSVIPEREVRMGCKYSLLLSSLLLLFLSPLNVCLQMYGHVRHFILSAPRYWFPSVWRWPRYPIGRSQQATHRASGPLESCGKDEHDTSICVRRWLHRSVSIPWSEAMVYIHSCLQSKQLRKVSTM